MVLPLTSRSAAQQAGEQQLEVGGPRLGDVHMEPGVTRGRGPRRWPGPSAVLGRVAVGEHRQLDDERRPLSFTGAPRSHGAAVLLQQVANDGQSHADPNGATPRVRLVWVTDSKTRAGNRAGCPPRRPAPQLDAGPRGAEPTRMWPPEGVNLLALESRFQNTCRRRCGSAETGAPMGRCAAAPRHLCCASGRMACEQDSRSAAGSRRGGAGELAVMTPRDSSRSSTICDCELALRSMDRRLALGGLVQRPGAAGAPSRGWRSAASAAVRDHRQDCP